MKINTAEFVISNSDVIPKTVCRICFYRQIKCWEVLINKYVDQPKKLAKTSGRPGKTQLINHFLINNNWFLVDLPGYGYAKVSKKTKSVFQQFITVILKQENNWFCFVLIDIRHEAQTIDIDMSIWEKVKSLSALFSLKQTRLVK
jgi:GTP-binding protein